MLPEKARKSNIAAAVWFLSMFALIAVITSDDGGNIWDEGDWLGILVFSIHGISLFAALWYYAEAKGYSGFVGIGLAFLYALGLLILLVLPDKTKEPETQASANEDPQKYVDEYLQKTGNLIIRVFNGDVSLPITYWVWGGLGGVVFVVANALVEFNYAQIIIHDYGEPFIWIIFWVGIAYAIFAWIAIWRSAGKYKGKFWGTAARVMVVAGGLGSMSRIATDFSQDPNDEASLREQARMMNASLPIMLDAGTRYDSVVYEPNQLIHTYTIVDSTRDEYDVDYFVEIMTSDLATSLCDDADTKAMLASGVTLVYSYSDRAGIGVADIIISNSDCE
jgi:hypothetical protein